MQEAGLKIHHGQPDSISLAANTRLLCAESSTNDKAWLRLNELLQTLQLLYKMAASVGVAAEINSSEMHRHCRCLCQTRIWTGPTGRSPVNQA